MRRALVAISGALALAAAVGPPVSAQDPELEQVERRLEQRQEQLEQARGESRDVRGQLSVAQQRRQGLTADVRILQGDLQAALAELAEVQAALEVARHELALWTRRLERARDDLMARQGLLNARAATAYKLGPAAYAEALLGANDLASIADRTFYVERVLTVDAGLLEGVRVSRTLVATRQDRVGVYEDGVSKRLREVHRQTERIAAMKAQQESLLEQIDLEIDFTAETLDDLNAARERYEDAVAQLEAESAQIQGLIQGSGSSGSGQYGGELFWPTNGPIVSGFGYRTHPVYGTTRFHSGVDIDGACGQAIFAAEDGTVLSAGYNGGYGNATVIDHGDGLSTLYAHQSSIGVSSGQKVGRDQQIGLVGTTGLSTGCHLHFEVRINGEPVDPVPYLT
ncbi:MAG: murein hydrolase activator EnvC family protein [Actinomycetota bacterium]